MLSRLLMILLLTTYSMAAQSSTSDSSNPLNKIETNEIMNRLAQEEELNKTDLICSICLDEYEAGQTLSEFKNCVHKFHKECIDQWLENNNSCPLCRDEMLTQQNSSSPSGGTVNGHVSLIDCLPFFLGNRRLSGAQPIAEFLRIIDEELTRQNSNENSEEEETSTESGCRTRQTGS